MAILLQTRNQHHGRRAVRQRELHPAVVETLDPHRRGRQYVVTRIAALAGTRIAGLTLTRCKSPAQWFLATYAVASTEAEGQYPLPL